MIILVNNLINKLNHEETQGLECIALKPLFTMSMY